MSRASGDLTDWNQRDGLDHAYPFGGHLTHRLLHGDPRKIVLARHDIPLSSGNHRAPGHKPDPDRLSAVHHFKWRTGILDDLRRRVHHFSTGLWREQSPAVRAEAGRFLAHVGRYQGRVNVADPRFAFRRVGLDLMPHSWPAEARTIHTTWLPRTGSGRQDGQ